MLTLLSMSDTGADTVDRGKQKADVGVQTRYQHVMPRSPQNYCKS
jgi:hypothetical protein